MDCAAHKGNAAFNRIELLVVIAAVFVVAMLAYIPIGTSNSIAKSMRIRCVNNLKEIGTAIRVFENDNGDSLKSITGSNCWSFYAKLLNGGRNSILTCPADERKPATDGETLHDNGHLSYFTTANATNMHPQSLLGGDRNIGPGTIPDPEYGYSPATGLGNDVTLTNDVCWSLKMHSRRIVLGAGNVLLADGSVEMTSSAGLRTCVRSAIEGTDVIHILFP